MSARIASSISAVPYSRIRELAEIALGMDGVLRLYFGESNQPTPEYIKEAARQALADGYTFYTSNAGLPSLRQAIARQYAVLQGVTVDPATQVVITASGVQALNAAIRAVLDPGDEALVLTPAWPNGAAIAQMANAVVKQIAHPLAGTRYEIDFDALEAAVSPRTRLLLYTSPSNPLGWTATLRDQERLLEFARRHGLWLFADEVYDRLYYGANAAPTILRLTEPDDAVAVIHSFSKTYCMTGWRLGYLIARPDLAQQCAQMNEYIVSHATSFIQKAAETALADGEAELGRMIAGLRANRDYCLEKMRAMPGVTVPEPEGAFYLFAKIAGLEDSFAFCRELLLETRVGIAPGVAFGAGGEGSVRICYAADRAVLEPAMQRLGAFLASRRQPLAEAIQSL